MDDETDRRFERRLRWLLLLLLLVAVLLTGTNLLPGPAWAEMPTDRALLAVTRGQATVVVDGTTLHLRDGDEVYVRDGDRVSVAGRSSARLTFRGGSIAVLCGGTELGVGELVSDGQRPIQPYGRVAVTSGRVLADTQTASTAFRPLRLTIATPAGETMSLAAARFLADPGASQLSTGDATFDGEPMTATGARLTCGDGVALPVKKSASPSPSPEESPSPSESPSASPSPSPSATGSPSPSRSRTPSRSPSVSPSRSAPTTPGDITPPVISNVASASPWIDPNGCPFGTTTVISAVVTDPDDAVSQLRVRFQYLFPGGTPGDVPMFFDSRTNSFRGTLGPFQQLSRNDLTIAVTAIAVDDNGNVAQAKPISVTFLAQCVVG